MDVVLAVDGGNSKTDVVLAAADGEPIAWVRGAGSNSHAPGGAAGSVAVIASLVERLPFEPPAAHGAFFLCGADRPADREALAAEIGSRRWARSTVVENDTFALLRAGTDRPDAVAIVCGAGINSVGTSAAGRVATYPALGWETGDWGGAEALGREALYHAARAEDGRGEQTALTDVVRSQFGCGPAALGGDIHYRRVRPAQLGELAPAIVAVAAAGDAVALALVRRLADEIAALVRRAMRDLGLREADVVLGGGMLAAGSGLLHELAVAALPDGVHAVVPELPPVAGAALAAFDALELPDAAARFRVAFRGRQPEDARG